MTGAERLNLSEYSKWQLRFPYPNWGVPLPVLGRLLVSLFFRLGFEGFILLLRHFHNCIFGFLQLGTLFSGSLPTPPDLKH